MIIVKNPSITTTITIYITSSLSVDIGAEASIDLLTNFTRPQLAGSLDLFNKIKDEEIIINDGVEDKTWLEAIDLIKDYRSPQTLVDGGAILVSQTYAETPQAASWKRRRHTATAEITTFFDIEIVNEIRLAGGDYKILNFSDVHENDYIEFSLVDKNDVLGLFSTYGLTVGVDVLELFKFVRNEYPDEKSIFLSHIGSAYNVAAGLFFRIGYNSYGATDINLLSRIAWYE